MKQILLISPDAALIRRLARSLARVKSQGTATVLREYPSPGQLANLVETKRPALVIVSLRDAERALALIQLVGRGLWGVPVAAAHTVNESETILAAVRAGAVEYLGPPFQTDQIERLLARPPRLPNPASSKGKLIAFVPARAGAGASTAALHTAAALAEKTGQRTLVVDYDFHSGSLDFCLRLKPENTLLQALRRSAELDDIWPSLPCRWKNIDLLAAPAAYTVRPEDLIEARVLFSFLKTRYEYAVVDLPPAAFSSCREALTEATTLYLVTTPELLSLHLARRRVLELFDLGIARSSVELVLSRVDPASGFTSEDVTRLVGLPVAWTLPNDYRAVARAHQEGKLVSPGSALGRQFQELARRILGITEAAPKPERTWKFNLKDWRPAIEGLQSMLRRRTQAEVPADRAPTSAPLRAKGSGESAGPIASAPY